MSAENGTQFGREIADLALAQLASAGIVEQRKLTYMRMLVDRADFAMQAAARGREADGVPVDEAADWLRLAREGFGARMREAAAGSRPDGSPR